MARFRPRGRKARRGKTRFHHALDAAALELLAAEGRRPPRAYTARELRDLCVEDIVAGRHQFPHYLAWFMWAVDRIAEQEKSTREKVAQDVLGMAEAMKPGVTL